MQEFTFEPNVRPLPLRFGMRPADGERIVGAPASLVSGDLDRRVHVRPDYMLSFSKGKGSR